MALINVLFLAVVTTVFLGAASQFVANSMKEGRRVRQGQQAYHVAQAGLNEAIAWLRKQETKPVASFDILDNLTAPDDATVDEQTGLVKEWWVDENAMLAARFEVGRDPGAPARTGITVGTRSGVTWFAEDISRQRGYTDPGTVWLLRSRGIVYKRPTPSSTYTSGIKPVDTAMLETEVQLTDFKGRQAALYDFLAAADATTVPTDATCGQTGGHIQIHSHGGSPGNVKLVAEAGMAYNVWANTTESMVRMRDGDGSNVFGPMALGITGTTHAQYVAPDLGKQLEHCFGVSDLSSARALASDYYDAANPPPADLPQMGFVYVNATGMTGGRMVFDSATQKLAGGGILLVEGDLEVNGVSVAQSWDGLIFVTGNYYQYNSARVTGGVVCGGRVRIHGTTSKVAELRYSYETVERVCTRLATYREERATLSTTASASPATY